jgi:phage terminase large subunit
LYYYRPVEFVREVVGGDPDEKQAELLVGVAKGERRISVRSGHRVGKTTVLAWLVLWWICTRFPQKTVCTAPTQDQLFDALVPEIKTWLAKMPQPLQDQFESQSERIFLKTKPAESFVAFKTSRPDKPEAMAGVHSENVLLIGDEASGIPEQVFESSIGSMAGTGSRMVLAGNPVRTSGTFYDTFHKLRDRWHTIHISCVGHPRITEDFIEDVRRKYGELSNAFRVRVLGEFPTADDDTVIPFELVESALKREVEAHTVLEIWGLDVARFGTDATALARRQGNVLVQPVEERRGYDLMRTVGWVKAEYDKRLPSQRPSEILVDSIGMGSGVLDRLVELGLPARGINVSETPTLFDERYLNQRAELWFSGKAWLDRKDCSLAGDDGLAAELIVVKYGHTSSGKLQVESKESLKKRGHPSPNKADAFLLTFAGDAVTAIGGGSTKTSWKTPLKRVIKGLV